MKTPEPQGCKEFEHCYHQGSVTANTLTGDPRDVLDKAMDALDHGAEQCLREVTAGKERPGENS